VLTHQFQIFDAKSSLRTRRQTDPAGLAEPAQLTRTLPVRDTPCFFGAREVYRYLLVVSACSAMPLFPFLISHHLLPSYSKTTSWKPCRIPTFSNTSSLVIQVRVLVADPALKKVESRERNSGYCTARFSASSPTAVRTVITDRRGCCLSGCVCLCLAGWWNWYRSIFFMATIGLTLCLSLP
jgi:hypothetical protein